jgi:hypothetical protein
MRKCKSTSCISIQTLHIRQPSENIKLICTRSEAGYTEDLLFALILHSVGKEIILHYLDTLFG